MSTEEENKITSVVKTFFDRWFPQIKIYAWMYEAIHRFSNAERLDGIALMRVSRRAPITPAQSVMDKIEEFNRAVADEPEVVEIRSRLADDGREVTLEMLERELEDDEDIDICPNGDWHIGGDNPAEIGRRIHEEAERLGINDREFPNRAPIRGGLNVFSRHNLCRTCARTSCDVEIMINVLRDNHCDGFAPKEDFKDAFCLVCGREFDMCFPEGFPSKWRVCCYCLDVWKYGNNLLDGDNLLTGLNLSDLKNLWEVRKEKLKKVFTL